MKDLSKGTSLVMMSIVAVAIGGTYFITEATHESSFTTQEDSGFMSGHLEVIVYDENGNIKAYRQSDNNIVEDGIEIMAKQIFTSLLTTTGGGDGPVSHLQVGTGGETAPLPAQTGLTTAISGCARVVSIHTGETSAGNSGGFADMDVTVTATVSAVSDTDCAVSSIDEAGLFNDLTAGEMFARNTFTAVTLTTSDSLALTWVFSLKDS